MKKVAILAAPHVDYVDFQDSGSGCTARRPSNGVQPARALQAPFLTKNITSTRLVSVQIQAFPFFPVCFIESGSVFLCFVVGSDCDMEKNIRQVFH